MTSSTPDLAGASSGRARAWPAALACALAGVAVFQFFGNASRGYIDTASLFRWWGFQWINPASETEHGWLILAASAWLLWRNLRIADCGMLNADRTNPKSAIRNPQSAVAAMAAGLALHLMGFAAQQARVSILALLLFAWGAVRLGGGRRWGAAAMFPLGFLVFAVPLGALDEVGLPLRLWVVAAGENLAHLAGIEVLRSGTQLVAPDGSYHYDVAAPCSGVRSLTALLALALFTGYLNFQATWRRALVLALCFPLVYLGNVARIAAIVLAAHWGGPAWGERAHAVMGYGVFVIVLGGVLGAVAALRRWGPEKAKWESRDGRGEMGREAETHYRAWRAAGIVVALAVGELFFQQHLATRLPRGNAGVALAADGVNPVELPAFAGTEWFGRSLEVSAVEREILPTDTGFSRKLYHAATDAKQRVFLSIVLSGGDRTSIHRPELCLVGQGWTVERATEHRFKFPGSVGNTFPATVLHVRREIATPRGKVVVPQLVAYWFVGGDEVVATHARRLALDAWNRVVRGRADRWAYVLVQCDAAEGEAAALARMQSVLDGTLPAFQRPLQPPDSRSPASGDGKKT